MPTNALGILIFATLFVPGFIHRETRRTFRPFRSNRSAFEQTTEIVTVSLVVNLVVGPVFVTLRFNNWMASHTPDLQALFEDFDQYVFTGDPARIAYVLWWFAAYILTCSLLAVLIAQAARSKSTDESDRRKRLETLASMIAGPIRADPAWYRVFETYVRDTESVWVGCSLTDGRYVAGILDYFSTDTNETGDRDLLIRAPSYFDGDGEPLEGEGDLHWTLLSARSIVRIDVSYVTALPKSDTSSIRGPGSS